MSSSLQDLAIIYEMFLKLKPISFNTRSHCWIPHLTPDDVRFEADEVEYK